MNLRLLLFGTVAFLFAAPALTFAEVGGDLPVSPESVSSASLRLMLREQPKDLSLRLRLARACMRENDLISGVSESVYIIREDPDCAEAHLYIARSLRLLRGNTSKCLHHAREAARLNSGLSYQKELLNALYYLKRYDEALDLARDLTLHFDDPSIRYNLAVIYMRLGRRAEMRKVASEILQKNENFISALTLLASDLIEHQRCDDALPYAERALSADPNDLLAHYLRGRVAFAQGEMQRARKEFEFVVDHDPFHHHALFQLTRTYASLGLHDKAKKARQSLEAVKELPEEKRERYRSYLQTHPDTVATHWRLGIIYLETQRGNLAAREFRRVLELDPQHGDALLTLAGIHTACGEYETALSHLDRALDCHPDRIAVLFARAVALHGLGKDREAEAALKEILSLNPNHAKAQEILKRVNVPGSERKSYKE